MNDYSKYGYLMAKEALFVPIGSKGLLPSIPTPPMEQLDPGSGSSSRKPAPTVPKYTPPAPSPVEAPAQPTPAQPTAPQVTPEQHQAAGRQFYRYRAPGNFPDKRVTIPQWMQEKIKGSWMTPDEERAFQERVSQWSRQRHAEASPGWSMGDPNAYYRARNLVNQGKLKSHPDRRPSATAEEQAEYARRMDNIRKSEQEQINRDLANPATTADALGLTDRTIGGTGIDNPWSEAAITPIEAIGNTGNAIGGAVKRKVKSEGGDIAEHLGGRAAEGAEKKLMPKIRGEIDNIEKRVDKKVEAITQQIVGAPPGPDASAEEKAEYARKREEMAKLGMGEYIRRMMVTNTKKDLADMMKKWAGPVLAGGGGLLGLIMLLMALRGRGGGGQQGLQTTMAPSPMAGLPAQQIYR